ncbi:hypothetical protein HK104_009655 [Borealophlyctis nickersoniae]|nr:hypothetical protein HK104_009655 [Borealophlyctis nickersoniae]
MDPLLSFTTADDELLRSFINEDCLSEGSADPAGSKLPLAPSSPSLLFDSLASCSSPSQTASPPTTTWRMDPGSESDPDSLLHSFPAFLGQNVDLGIVKSPSSPLSDALFASPPPAPLVDTRAQVLDVSAVLESGTADACRALLSEPSKRRTGKRKKAEAPGKPSNAGLVSVKKEDDESPNAAVSTVPTVKINFAAFPTLVPKKEESKSDAANTVNPVSISTQPGNASPSSTSSTTKEPALTPEQIAANKRHERMIKNREAADQSRRRKREHLQNLENLAQQLVAENDLLRHKVLELEQTNRVLMDENERLRGRGGDGFRVAIDYDPTMRLAVPSKRRPSMDAFLEPPKKKTVGAVFMVFLFSFAMLFFPGSIRPHAGGHGHIAGKAFSSISSEAAAGRYLDGSPRPLALPPSSSYPEERSLVPFSLPSTVVDTSSLPLPLDGNFTELLDVLSAESGLSKESRAQIAKLHALFKNTEGRPRHQKWRGRVAKRLLDGGHEPHRESDSPPYIYLPASDSNPSQTAPYVTVTDLIRLVPYQSQPSPMVSPSPRRCNRVCVNANGLVEDASTFPRLSLVAALPGGETHGHEDAVGGGGLLRLDLEVIDARLIKWNESKEEAVVGL